MEGRHWSRDELIAGLYGIGGGSEHLRECAVCASRMAEMRARRQRSFTDVILTNAELEQQRREWQSRMEAGPAPAAWKVLAGCAALIAIGIALSPSPPRVASDDRGLYEDAFVRVASDQLDSFAPIENLFEVKKP
jgi:hypothetical protein